MILTIDPNFQRDIQVDFAWKVGLRFLPLKVTPPTPGLRGSRAGTREEDFGRLRGGGEEGPLGVFCGLCIGGRGYIIPQLAVYTTYIPLIYCLLGGYMLPTTCRWWNAFFFLNGGTFTNSIHLYSPILTGKSNSWLIFIGSIILECWICFFFVIFTDFTMGFITFQHHLGEYVWLTLSKHRTWKGMKAYPPASSKGCGLNPKTRSTVHLLSSHPSEVLGSSRGNYVGKPGNQHPKIHQIIMECHWCVLNTCSEWEQGQNQEMHNIGSRWALSLVISRVISPFIGGERTPATQRQFIGPFTTGRGPTMLVRPWTSLDLKLALHGQAELEEKLKVLEIFSEASSNKMELWGFWWWGRRRRFCWWFWWWVLSLKMSSVQFILVGWFIQRIVLTTFMGIAISQYKNPVINQSGFNVSQGFGKPLRFLL